jgi:hypothetical protein
MGESRTDDIPQVPQKENNLLTTPYTDDEVRKVVFQMEHNKASGSDDFPAEFYQFSGMFLSLACLLYLVTSIPDN